MVCPEARFNDLITWINQLRYVCPVIAMVVVAQSEIIFIVD
jgi:hypothetical protein